MTSVYSLKPVIHVLMVIASIILLQGCASSKAKLLDEYSSKPGHKAFAETAYKDAAGAGWGQPTIEAAIDVALSMCRSRSYFGCRITKINNDNEQSRPSNYFSSFNTGNHGHTRVYRCDELSKGQAYSFLLSGHFYLDRDGDGNPCEWGKTNHRSTRSYSTGSNCHWVGGYRRKNGTYVRGHRRCR